jgi:hypothetical protein
MRFLQSLHAFVLAVWLGPVAFLAAQPGTHASGGGTYSPNPKEGILSEFQFSEAHVQCKIAHAVLPDGTVLQMFMDSTSIDSVTINSAAKTAVIKGSMTSLVRLRLPDGSMITLSESVPYTVNAEDNGTPGAGTDKFSLTVKYDPVAPKSGGLNQAALFGSPAIFAGTLLSGDIVIH